MIENWLELSLYVVLLLLQCTTSIILTFSDFGGPVMCIWMFFVYFQNFYSIVQTQVISSLPLMLYLVFCYHLQCFYEVSVSLSGQCILRIDPRCTFSFRDIFKKVTVQDVEKCIILHGLEKERSRNFQF